MDRPDSVLALIPARGGSVRLPGKNLRDFGGKPLIAWSIEVARQVPGARAVVSTDSQEIATVAQQFGAEVPFMRPASLATSEASSVDVALHAFDELGSFDWLLLLQPTSPLRTDEDVFRSADLRGDVVVSICPADDGDAHRCTLDLDLDPAGDYRLNGAIYWIRPSLLRQSRTFLPAGAVPYVMPAHRSVDIDTAEDWEAAVAQLARL